MNVDKRFQSAPALLDALRSLAPGGFALHESMLAPLAQAERTILMPRLEPSEARSADLGLASSGAPTVSVSGLSGTQQSLARTTRPARKSTAPLLLGVGVVLAAGGAAAYFGLSQRHAGDGAAAAAPEVSVAAVPPSAAPVVPTAQPSAPPAASPAAERTVRLAVAPAGVKVEIDGAPVDARDGVIELRGPLGSTHRVLLRLTGQQLVRDVAITENGALPDRLELGAPQVRSRAPIARTPSVAPGVPAAPAAIAPAAPAKPTAPAKPNAVSLDRKFE